MSGLDFDEGQTLQTSVQTHLPPQEDEDVMTGFQSPRRKAVKDKHLQIW